MILVGHFAPTCYFRLPFLHPTDCCAEFVLGVAFLFHFCGDKHLISQAGFPPSIHVSTFNEEVVTIVEISQNIYIYNRDVIVGFNQL